MKWSRLKLVAAEAFTKEADAKDYTTRMRQSPATGETCVTRMYGRTVRAGGLDFAVWVVVVREKANGKAPRS